YGGAGLYGGMLGGPLGLGFGYPYYPYYPYYGYGGFGGLGFGGFGGVGGFGFCGFWAWLGVWVSGFWFRFGFLCPFLGLWIPVLGLWFWWIWIWWIWISLLRPRLWVW